MHATLASLWSEHSQRRLSWAEAAYAQFLSSIAPELAAQYRDHRDEVTVVVYGKTQVGKTTLILKLMGVAPEQMSLVSRVLRGGRSKGNSATPTAMVYSRSLDDGWRLVVEGASTTYESPDAMEDGLRLLREKMEFGQLFTNRPVQVQLPAVLFGETSNQNLAVNIVDLPGDSPANAIEKAHVSHVASQYIPNADLVLLVGKADDLGFIDPEKLVLPVLGDWRYSPGRFRLITTFTVQSASFRGWLQRHSQVDATSIRQRLLSQLETFDDIELPPDARELKLYFPMDFGESWDTLKAMEPETYARTKTAMEGLFDELKQDIQKSASKHMRLWRATQVHIVANRVKRAREGQARVEIDKSLTDAANIHRRSQALLLTAGNLSEKASNLPTSEQVDEFLGGLRGQLIQYLSKLRAPGAFENKTVSGLLDSLHVEVETVIRLGHAFEPAAWLGFDLNLHVPSPAIVRAWIEPSLSSFRKRLNDYTFDAYQSWLFKSYETDIAEFNRLRKDIVLGLRIKLENHWMNELHRLDEAWGRERTELHQQASVARTDAATCEVKFREMKSSAIQKEQQLQSFVTRLEQDEAKGARFVGMLEDEYTAHVLRLTADYQHQATPSAKFLVLLALRQLQEEKTSLFSLGDTGQQTKYD